MPNYWDHTGSQAERVSPFQLSSSTLRVVSLCESLSNVWVSVHRHSSMIATKIHIGAKVVGVIHETTDTETGVPFTGYVKADRWGAMTYVTHRTFVSHILKKAGY